MRARVTTSILPSPTVQQRGKETRILTRRRPAAARAAPPGGQPQRGPARGRLRLTPFPHPNTHSRKHTHNPLYPQPLHPHTNIGTTKPSCTVNPRPTWSITPYLQVERFVFRPHLADKARYYAVVFLAGLPLSHRSSEGGEALARRLVELYFTLFRMVVEGHIGAAAGLRKKQVGRAEEQQGKIGGRVGGVQTVQWGGGGAHRGDGG